jgi:hemerythrin-like domain-containing protein
MMALQTHVSQEENEMFPKIRDNFSHEQHKQMATEFKTVKSKLQVQIAATKQ